MGLLTGRRRGLAWLLVGALLPAAVASAQTDTVVAAADAETPRRFDGVTWQGVSGELLDNLRRKVSLGRFKVGTTLRPARFEHFLRQLPREVDDALAPFGHYNASLQVDPVRGEQALSVRITVDPGEPVTVGTLALRIDGPGGSDRRLQDAVQRFAPGEGAPFRHDVYETSKADIARRLADRGYFEARLVEAKVTVNRAQRSADIVLHWDSGPRYRFGEVHIRGEDFRPSVLEPLIPFQPGDEFRQPQLLELQRRFADLDYFRRIDVQPRLAEPLLTGIADEHDTPATAPDTTPSTTPPQVPIDVEVEMAPRNVYRSGLSYGTDNGAAIKLGYSRRWLNDRGHKLDGDVLLGEQRTLGALRYRIPSFEYLPGWWTNSLALRDERFGDVDSNIAELAVQREARLRNNQYTAGFFVQREEFLGRGKTVAYPQLSMERSLSDDPLYPRRGFRWKLLARVAHGAFGSQVDLAQILASATLVMPLGDGNRLILRGEAGTTATDHFDDVPPSLRFYAGGDRSVRGYGFQELGPRNDDGLRIGGKRLAVGSAEFERMFTPQWGGAIFVDGGDAFDSRFKASLGVGIGVRWRSPVGPIRVDIGRGLDDPEEGFRLHIQLGPEL